jgi:hypothetical protein
MRVKTVLFFLVFLVFAKNNKIFFSNKDLLFIFFLFLLRIIRPTLLKETFDKRITFLNCSRKLNAKDPIFTSTPSLKSRCGGYRFGRSNRRKDGFFMTF